MTDEESAALYDLFVETCIDYYEDTTADDSTSSDFPDFAFPDRITDWLEDNNLKWVDLYELLDDFMTAAEFNGVDPLTFLRNIPEQAIVAEEQGFCEVVHFKTKPMFDKFVTECSDHQERDRYKQPKDPLTTEGPCWRLHDKYFELRPKGGVWILLDLGGFTDFCDRIEPLLKKDDNDLYVVAGYVELSEGSYDSRFAIIRPLSERIMVGPFKSEGDAVYFRLSLPEPIHTPYEF